MTTREPEAPVSAVDAAARFLRGPAPPWVLDIAPGAHAADADHGAASWFLLDEQFELMDGAPKRFMRQVWRANNSVGADSLAEVRMTFNPSFETLILHAVTVHRGGESFDALEDADIDVLRVEEDMYARVYRGDYAVVIQIRGLKAGDVIDHALTIEGVNPVLGGRVVFHARHAFEQALARRHLRVLLPLVSRVGIHQRGPAHEVARRIVGRAEECVIDLLDLPGREFELFAPPEADEQASVTILTDFQSWREVAAWSAELYALDPNDAAVAKVADAALAERPDAPAMAAIAFVQDEIRYVSTNYGEGGYRPRTPEVVLKRSYGDCKDKALLLAAVLRRLGQEAEVALVDTQAPYGPLTAIPAPSAFNHVVVRARIDGEPVWIDATMQGQRGRLSVRSQPWGMAALVIHPDTEGLVMTPPAPGNLITSLSESTFDLSAGPGEPVIVAGDDISRGSSAENLRRALQMEGQAGVQRILLNAWEQEHGEVVAERFEFQDDPVLNQMRLIYRLRLPDPWRVGPDGAAAFRQTICFATQLLPAIPAGRRTLPLQVLEHPLHHIHRETVLLPKRGKPIGLRTQEVARENAGFQFRRRETLSRDKLLLEVETRTLARAVPAADALEALRDQAALQDAHVMLLTFPPRRRGMWGG